MFQPIKPVFFNDAYANLAYLREPIVEPLVKSDDSIKGQIISSLVLQKR